MAKGKKAATKRAPLSLKTLRAELVRADEKNVQAAERVEQVEAEIKRFLNANRLDHCFFEDDCECGGSMSVEDRLRFVVVELNGDEVVKVPINAFLTFADHLRG